MSPLTPSRTRQGRTNTARRVAPRRRVIVIGMGCLLLGTLAAAAVVVVIAIKTVISAPLTCTVGSLRSVAPSTANPALGTAFTEPSADSCYGQPTSTSNGKLLVFLPGSGAIPADYQKILVA